MSDSLGRRFYEFRPGFAGVRLRHNTAPSETVYTNIVQVGFQVAVSASAPVPFYSRPCTHNFFMCMRRCRQGWCTTQGRYDGTYPHFYTRGLQTSRQIASCQYS